MYKLRQRTSTSHVFNRMPYTQVDFMSLYHHSRYMTQAKFVHRLLRLRREEVDIAPSSTQSKDDQLSPERKQGHSQEWCSK